MFKKELRDSDCRCGVCGWYGDLTTTCTDCGSDEIFLITEDDFEIEED